MDLIQNIIKITSELGLSYLNQKVEEKVSFAKKTALSLYIINSLVTALISLFVFLISFGLIYSFFNGPEIMAILGKREFFLSATFVFIVICLLIFIAHLKAKINSNSKNQFSNKELTEKILPLVEAVLLNLTDNQKYKNEIERLKKDNQHLKSKISEQ